jgi:hypothetical protein
LIDAHTKGRRKVSTFLVWIPALVAYALFLGWYVNWRGPVTPKEAETLIARLVASGAGENDRNDLDIMRRFLAEDDGREFFMLNLVRLAPGDIPNPTTGALEPARKVVEGYTRMFMPALFARGGHPAIVGRKIGGYFDAWGVEADPGWTIMGYMRYRSRRDLAMLASDPRFAGAHDFKFAAMPNTYSFPTHPQMLTLASPKVWVALALALMAALAQIGWLLAMRPSA